MTQDGINPRRGGPGQNTEDFHAQYGSAWREQEWNNKRDELLDLRCYPRFRADINQAEAVAPRLGCQLEGTVSLRKPQHAGFVLPEWVLSTQAF